MRRILSALAVLVFGGAAYAADISFTAQQLGTDIAARIAAIGTPSGSALKNELKNLNSAQAKLAKYTGQESVAALKVLAGAGKFVALSRTHDPAITQDIATLLDAMCDGVKKRQSFFEDAKSQLVDPKHVALVDAAVKAADQAFDGGKAAVASNPVKAASLIIKAYDLFGLMTAKTRKLVTAEDGAPPPEGLNIVLGASSVQLVNSSATAYDISKIRVFGAVTDGASVVKSFTGQTLKSLAPNFFSAAGSSRIAAATAAPTVYDLTAAILETIPPGTMNAHVAGEMQVTLKREPFFVIVFSIAAP